MIHLHDNSISTFEVDTKVVDTAVLTEEEMRIAMQTLSGTTLIASPAVTLTLELALGVSLRSVMTNSPDVALDVRTVYTIDRSMDGLIYTRHTLK